MPQQDEPSQIPFTLMRRKNRAVNDADWIRALLQRAAMGTLAFVDDGRPLVHMNLFVLDGDRDALYFHTANQGQTHAAIASGGQVCFCISEMGRLLPADTAIEFSVEFASVVVHGQARIVTDPDEAQHGLQLLLDKYFPHLQPGQNYRPIQPAELARTTVYRIDIEQWSGKRKQAPPDFEGAFVYEPRR